MWPHIAGSKRNRSLSHQYARLEMRERYVCQRTDRTGLSAYGGNITVKRHATPGHPARPGDQRPSPLLIGPAVVVAYSSTLIRGATNDHFCFPGDHSMKSSIVCATAVVMALGSSACTGPRGPAGAQGVTGQTGRTGTDTVIVSPTHAGTTTVDTVITSPTRPTKTTTTTTRRYSGYDSY